MIKKKTSENKQKSQKKKKNNRNYVCVGRAADGVFQRRATLCKLATGASGGHRHRFNLFFILFLYNITKLQRLSKNNNNNRTIGAPTDQRRTLNAPI
jgi:hypothetical protein